MSNNKAVRAIVGIVAAILIILGLVFSIAYHVWTSRGDQVAFSPTLSFGLGNTPISAKNGKGEDIQYGTYHNFLFVRDTSIDVKGAHALMGR